MEQYRQTLDSIRPDTSFGCTTIHVYRSQDLAAAQIGYSVSANGEPLIGGKECDWHKSWLVIGYDDTSGDPLFIDTSEEGLPVYTAMIGQDSWHRERIAISLAGFENALSIIASVAKGREHPAALENNPLTQSEKDTALLKIRQQNPRVDLRFWQSLLGDS
jgi:hypothetical protein